MGAAGHVRGDSGTPLELEASEAQLHLRKDLITFRVVNGVQKGVLKMAPFSNMAVVSLPIRKELITFGTERFTTQLLYSYLY